MDRVGKRDKIDKNEGGVKKRHDLLPEGRIIGSTRGQLLNRVHAAELIHHESVGARLPKRRGRARRREEHSAGDATAEEQLWTSDGRQHKRRECGGVVFRDAPGELRESSEAKRGGPSSLMRVCKRPRSTRTFGAERRGQKNRQQEVQPLS